MSKTWKLVACVSIGLNFILILLLVFYGGEREPAPLVARTQQDIDKAVSVQIGVTSQELFNEMGSPVKRDAENEREEWYYCRTGTSVDEFVRFSLVSGKVYKINNYTVSGAEANGLAGNCELFFKYSTSRSSSGASSMQGAESGSASD